MPIKKPQFQENYEALQTAQSFAKNNVNPKPKMAPVVAASLIQAGVSLVNGIANSISQNKAIDKQNEYNSPASQMQRLKEAGLNPNLIYGSIQSGNQTSIPSANYDFNGLANIYLASKQLEIQKELAESQKEVDKANIANTNADTENKKQGNLNLIEQTAQLKYANWLSENLQKYIEQHPDDYFLPKVYELKKQLEHIATIDDQAQQRIEMDKVMNSKLMEEINSKIDLNKGMKSYYAALEKKTDKERALIEKDIENYVARFLSSPTPWYAELISEIIKDKLGIDNDATVGEVINEYIDRVDAETQDVKNEGKRKIGSIYHSRYVAHDDKYTYKEYYAGENKGKYCRIEQATGRVEIINDLPEHIKKK